MSSAGARGPCLLSLRLVSLLEVIATLLGVANILLLVRRSIWNYPFGLVMVALYARIFFDARLYSDSALQIFFFIIQLYGWWAWWRAGGASHAIAVERLTPAARLAWIAMIAFTSVAWGSIMHTYTDASFPWIDAGIAMGSIAAQVLLARRCIENWVLWIAIDVVSVGLYMAKGLYPTAGLYVLFLIISVAGLIEWRRVERRTLAEPQASSGG
jgi:nicotinamide mononucleotide transporter